MKKCVRNASLRRCLSIRVASGILLLGLGLPLTATAARRCQRELPDQSPQTCARCHVAIARQWAASGHARAWTNPDFVAQTSSPEDKVCLPCHASEPVLQDVAPALLRLRSENREAGIDCHTCHATESGYAGPYATWGPHATQRDRTRLPDSALCGRCHMVEFQQYTDRYRPSLPPADSPRQCAECHMPLYIARLTQGHLLSLAHPRRITHDHTFLVWDQQITRDAIEIHAPTARRQDVAQWEVAFSLVNRGAGHLIPTAKFGHRELCIRAELLDAQRRVLGQQETSLFAANESGLVPGAVTPFRLLVKIPQDALPAQLQISVQRVNKDRSFSYLLASDTQSIDAPAHGVR